MDDVYGGPLSCMEIACRNAEVELSLRDIAALTQELIDMGANFDE